ncbi:MAG: nucleotidyl transferase AbiEii/AbiGii toxin family protein [Promethearchaeota archaeon]
MRRFIDELSRLVNYKYRDLIEIDLILCKILSELALNDFFYTNFLLKGGTCLIKNYLGYYRFSEAIDFTWRNQNINKNKSGKQLREDLSILINKIADIFEVICRKINLNFVVDKNNGKYFQFGGGNKMVTFKLYFNSEILNIEKFIKIQINFIECLKFEPIVGKLKSIIPEDKEPKYKELKFLYPEEYSEYSKDITFPVYNIKEILCEKVRAILTRKGTLKGRDFVDIYTILNKYDFDIKEIKNQIIEKTLFALHLYKKDKENLEEKKELINSGGLFTWGEEKRLLLKEIDNKDFYAFVNKFNVFLKKITKEICKNIPA